MGLCTKQVSGSTRLDLPPSVQQQPPQKAEALECPRCESTNTKFCYYNNYNKSQPRHFCKGCKRHWTAGGTLRNVPVGGSRKNKRLKTPSRAAAAEAEADHQQKPVIFSEDPKNAPSLFFPTIIRNDTVFENNKPFDVGPTSMVSHDDQETKILPSFSFSSSLGYFDNPPISCSIPSFNNNTQSSSNNNAYSDIIGEFDNVEESTITTVMPFISHQPPWQDQDQDQDQAIMNISNATDIANYWSLSDIDSLISADLNIPWDDLEIKPKGN